MPDKNDFSGILAELLQGQYRNNLILKQNNIRLEQIYDQLQWINEQQEQNKQISDQSFKAILGHLEDFNKLLAKMTS